jgi:multidrug transporter EmrE-like cation transporter
MRKSEIVKRTDAIMFIVLCGAVLSVALILLFVAGDKLIPPVGIAFALFAAIGSFIGLITNAIELIRIYRGTE